jgi:PAS domain S-box-containing protein
MRHSIRKKSLLIFSVLCSALIVVVALCARYIVLNGFLAVERTMIDKNLQRLQASLDAEYDNLRGMLADWAPWDLTYNFMTGTYPEYVTDNIDEATMAKLRVEVLLFVTPAGRIKYLHALDATRRRATTLSPAAQRQILACRRLFTHQDTHDVHTGILLLPEGPLLVGSHPIEHNDYTGPIAGTLLMGRFLDADELAYLSTLVNQPVDLSRWDAPKSPRYTDAVAHLHGTPNTYYQNVNSATTAGFLRLDDVNGRPALLMRVQVKRTVFLLGQWTVWYFMGFVFFSGLLYWGVFTLQNDRAVLQRVMALDASLKTIRGSEAFATRVTLPPPYLWPDELDTLSTTVNETLGALETAHRELLEQETLRASEEQYRGLIENSPDAVYVFHDTSCVFVNAAGVALLRAGSPYEVIGLDALACIPAAHQTLVRELHATVLGSTHRRAQRIEVAFQRFDGTEIDVEYTLTLFTYQGKPALYAIVRDITERKLAETAIANYQQRLRALSTELSLAEERERHRIAGDLHDHIGQTLVATRMVLGAVQDSLHETTTVEQIADVRQQLERAIEWTRSLTTDLYPPILSTRGFFDAARWLIDLYHTRHGLEITLESETEQLTLPDSLRGLLFTVLRELLQNVAKHARASCVHVVLNRRGDTFLLNVEDNGVGFDLASISECQGFGLFSIQERIHYCGGRVIIDATPGHGTRVFISVPLTEEGAPRTRGGSHARQHFSRG